MAVALEQTRREWAEGDRRLAAELRDTPRGEALAAELEAVLAALRKRVGQSFTLGDLADEYVAADAWSREAVAESEPASGWPRRLATVTAAAFHLYSRSAVDYEP
jgi:vacuolar-type H+-ATPase catalytic subunit A/Vma1